MGGGREKRGGGRGCGFSELSLEKPVGGCGGGVSSAHRSVSREERGRHLSIFLEVVSQAVLGEAK